LSLPVIVLCGWLYVKAKGTCSAAWYSHVPGGIKGAEARLGGFRLGYEGFFRVFAFFVIVPLHEIFIDASVSLKYLLILKHPET
jgi:hypothetical protein